MFQVSSLFYLYNTLKANRFCTKVLHKDRRMYAHTSIKTYTCITDNCKKQSKSKIETLLGQIITQKSTDRNKTNKPQLKARE